MPLKPGTSESVISDNIAEMRNSGHSEAQSVAAAEHNADKYKDNKMDQQETHDEMEHEVVKSPGNQLLEKLLSHHSEMLKGVESYIPAIEHEEKCNALKKYCTSVHKSMDDLVSKCGYGCKNVEMPEALHYEEKDADKGTNETGSLPEEELDEEENLSDDEKKMFLDKIAELENHAREQELKILKSKLNLG